MNHKQQLFANAYLRLTDPLVAYIQAYKPKDASNYRSIKSAANRLLRHPEIAAHISGVRNAALEQAQQELKEQMKEELLSVHDKRLYIKRVINGEIFIPYDYKAKGCNLCTVLLRPTFPQVLGYLKEDSRLAGHYPGKPKTSTRQQTTTTERSELVATAEKDINKATTIQDSFPVIRELRSNHDGQQTDINNGVTSGTNEESDGRVDDDSTQSQIEKTSVRQQNTTNTDNISLPPPERLSRAGFRGIGGTLAQDAREKQPTISNTGRTTSHAGLRKLLDKQRQRKNMKTESA